MCVCGNVNKCTCDGFNIKYEQDNIILVKEMYKDPLSSWSVYSVYYPNKKVFRTRLFSPCSPNKNYKKNDWQCFISKNITDDEDRTIEEYKFLGNDSCGYEKWIFRPFTCNTCICK